MKNNLFLNPALMLVAGILILGFLEWIFWPGKGLIARLNKIKLTNKRVLIEDALKFLFDCEYKNHSCDINTIAGNLNISNDNAAKLMTRLQSLGLILMENNLFRLTDTGRSYSLRVIRVHRIWEKYLAEETSISATEWHTEADYKEHRVSDKTVEMLAAQMGNPVFDPHGDPIPTAEGELPKPKGQTLSSLKEGDIANIIHIEDEPKSIYEQLLAEGFYPGMQIYITNIDDGKITLAADGNESVLTPLFASAITVEMVSGKAPLMKKHETLSSLLIGDKAIVAGISPNCMGQQRRRLMDLGIIPGSEISVEMKSASGDPVGYRIMGATVGIRKSQADLIFIYKQKKQTS